jgi:hypothetical protein
MINVKSQIGFNVRLKFLDAKSTENRIVLGRHQHHQNLEHILALRSDIFTRNQVETT